MELYSAEANATLRLHSVKHVLSPADVNINGSETTHAVARPASASKWPGARLPAHHARGHHKGVTRHRFSESIADGPERRPASPLSPLSRVLHPREHALNAVPTVEGKEAALRPGSAESAQLFSSLHVVTPRLEGSSAFALQGVVTDRANSPDGERLSCNVNSTPRAKPSFTFERGAAGPDEASCASIVSFVAGPTSVPSSGACTPASPGAAP